MQFPTPAIGASTLSELKDKEHGKKLSTSNEGQYSADVVNGDDEARNIQRRPGTLPECAQELSNGARSLLKRLLDPDPKVRMKNIRQLQQTAFYMGFNFEHVKAKKVPVKSILDRHFPNDQEKTEENIRGREFASFDQSIFSL